MASALPFMAICRWARANASPPDLRKLEQESRERDCAQLFIETPYRNQQMLSVLRHTLKPHTPADRRL